MKVVFCCILSTAIGLLCAMPTPTNAMTVSEKQDVPPAPNVTDSTYLSTTHKAYAKTISEKLAKFKSENPGVPGKMMRIVYFCPKGTQPHPGFEKRLTLWMDDFQNFYRDEMAINGFGQTPFAAERDSQNQMVIHIVEGDNGPDSYPYNWNVSHKILYECERKLAGKFKFKEENILLLTNKTWTRPDGTVRIEAPFYGVYQGMGGVGFAIDHPELTIANLANDTEKIRYSEHQWTMHEKKGRFATTYIGGALHELGHAWGLPHNQLLPLERRGNGVALMGNGNYTYRADRRHEREKTILSFPHAVQLISHPLFSGTTAQYAIVPKCTLEDFKIDTDTTAQTITLSGKITDANVAPYAVMMYADQEPYGAVNLDYDAYSAVVPVADDGTFAITFNARLVNKKNWQATLKACMVNGRTTVIKRHNFDKQQEPKK